MNDTTQPAKKEFFDLHTNGIGYLNRARTVTPSRGDDYESVTIAALHGRSDSPSYSYFDTIVVGADALDFVKEHKDTINDRDSKVLVRFKVGDGDATSYEVTSGDNKGNRNHCIKGRLLKITWAKINGVVVKDDAADEPVDSNSIDDPDSVNIDTTDTPAVDLGPLENDPAFLAKKIAM